MYVIALQVVLMNQVTTRIMEDQSSKLVPALGEWDIRMQFTPAGCRRMLMECYFDPVVEDRDSDCCLISRTMLCGQN